MSEVSRRRVTYGQLEQLWEFLSRNKSLALGFNKTAQAREFSQRMWKEVAESLNSHGDGAVKDWRGWSKYWSDYKSKLKSPQPGPSSRISPPLPAPLSPIRIRVIPRRSPRRRRQMRREIPMTQESARRTLIEISNRRADIEERRANIEEHNSRLIENLINEIREIKEILRLRWSASPRDGE